MDKCGTGAFWHKRVQIGAPLSKGHALHAFRNLAPLGKGGAPQTARWAQKGQGHLPGPFQSI